MAATINATAYDKQAEQPIRSWLRTILKPIQRLLSQPIALKLPSQLINLNHLVQTAQHQHRLQLGAIRQGGTHVETQ